MLSSARIILFFVILYKPGRADLILGKDDHGYEGIQISLEGEIKEEDCEGIINNLKNTIESASSSLLTATPDHLLWFKSATVVIPDVWSSCGSYPVDTIEYTLIGNPQIKIGPYHALFGDNPWTSQPRMCGLPGDFMYLSQDFLEEDGQESGNLILEEWAKLRWGVFEEYGIKGDVIYPPMYLDEEGYAPNYCTDVPLDVDFKDCEDEVNCTVVINDPQDPPALSSLMSLRNHSQAEQFCDDATHQATPTKHQILCGGRSVWEILLQHEDFRYTKTETPANTSFTISIVKPVLPKAKFIFVFEHSTKMSSLSNRLEYMSDSLSQMIESYLLSSSSVGLVPFSTEATVIYPLTLLDETSRKDAVSAIRNLSEPTQEHRNLTLALNTAASVLKQDGVIILITNDGLDMNDHYELTKAADGNAVWPVIFPIDGNNMTTWEYLAGATGGQFIVIENTIVSIPGIGNFQDVKALHQLTRAFRQIANHYQEKLLNQNQVKLCSNNLCNIQLTSPAGVGPHVMLFLYYSPAGLDDVDVFQENYLCQETPILEYQTQRGYLCTKNDISDVMQVGVSVSRTFVMGDIWLELVSLTDFSTAKLDVWTSHDMSSLHMDAFSQHMIYARVTLGGHELVGSAVLATVTTSEGETVIALADHGTLGDVTGNDGVHSGVFSQLIKSKGIFSYSVIANNNHGGAMMLKKDAEWSTICCGSKIQLPPKLPKVGQFDISSKTYSGLVTEISILHYPPGQILDLVYEEGDYDTLTFSSPGGELYYGRASKYNMYITMPDINGSGILYLTEEPKYAGQRESLYFNPIRCGELNYYRISAVNSEGLEGKASNEIKLNVSCDRPTTTSTTTTTVLTDSTTETGITSTIFSGTTKCSDCNEPLAVWAIVLISLGSVIIVGVMLYLLYFFCIKEQRKNNLHSVKSQYQI